MFHFLIGALFPGKCVSCGSKTAGGDHHFLCDSCAASVQVLSDGKTSGGNCGRCGAELYGAGSFLCYRCSGTVNYFQKNTSILSYRDPVVRDLFRLFKFGSNRLAGKDLARLLKRHLRSIIGNGSYDMVTIAPVSRATRRKRGYNQVEKVLELCGIPYQDLLKRHGPKRQQSELSAGDRQNLIRGQFQVDPVSSNSISGKKMLLIDDVYTTGNTANEISRVLVEAGAAKVDVLTFFRD